MIFKWVLNLLSDSDEKKLVKLRPIIAQINSLELALQKLSDEELKSRSAALKERAVAGENLDNFLPEAFALVREASVRTTGLRRLTITWLKETVSGWAPFIECLV